MTFHVIVTEEDIAAGRPCKPWLCPIARAIARVTRRRVRVWPGQCCIDDGPLIPMPEVTMQWISDFDGGRMVEPLEFELEVAA